MFVKHIKIGNMKSKYTYKSGGKVPQKIDLAGHVCFFFPPMP